jgi:Tfp pilus assembly protein FimT
MLVNKLSSHRYVNLATAGFTIIELSIILFMLGIFSAIAAPNWLAFINNNHLRTSQDRIYWAIRIAQSNAKRDKISWQASFREQNGIVQWAVHPAHISPNQITETISDELTESKWHRFAQKIKIDTSNTTLDKVDPANNQLKTSGNTYRALFNHNGCPVPNPEDHCTTIAQGQLGRITLKHEQLSEKNSRCVIVSTIIGAMRTAEDSTKDLSKGGCN